MVKDRHNVRLIGRVMTVSATLILVLVLFVLLLTRSTNASTTPLITTYTFTEVATGSSFPIMLTANVPSGRYSGCLVSLYYKIEGTGAATSARPGSYPGIEVLNLGGGTYFLRAPACSGGRSIEPGLHSLAHFTIQANSVGSIRFNTEPGRTPIIDGGGATFSPKVTYVNNDVCPNITGVQTSIPAGMIKDSSGNCVNPPPPDVCPNIAGVQATIPSGMIKNSSGHCVYPPSTPTNPTPPTNPPVTTNPPSTGNPPGTGGGTTTPGVRPSPVLPTVPAEISPDDKDSMTTTEDTPDTEEDDETGAINDVTVRAYPKSIEISWRGEVTLKDIKVRYGKDGETRELSASIINSEGSMHDATLLNLIPVTMYSIEISGVLEDGTVATYSGRAMTRGYPVGLYFKNGDTVLAKTKITVGGYDYETDDDGLRALELPSGKVEVVVVLEGGGKYREMIEVKDVTPNKDKVIPMQDFVIDVSAASMGSPLGYIIASILIGAVVSFLLFLLWRKRKRDKSDTDEWQPLTGVYSPMPAPIAPSATAPLAAPSMPVAPLSTTPMPTHDYTPIFTQGQYHNPVAPGQAYQDPYQALVDPQGGVDGDIEDIYEAAQREGRFKNIQ